MPASDELKSKLTRLLRRRPELLGEPLDETAIAAFERAHGIALPEDYRWFVSRLGNGGAGPDCDLFALGEMDDGHGFAAWNEEDGFVGRLRAPFPHSEAWNDLTGKPEDPDEPDYDAVFDAFEKRYFSPRTVDGAMPLAHLGCALRVWLVITGPERGHVWLDERADYEGLAPLTGDDGERLDFLSWYAAGIDDE